MPEAAKKFTGDETLVIRTAKSWDSPRAGTVPVLLAAIRLPVLVIVQSGVRRLHPLHQQRNLRLHH